MSLFVDPPFSLGQTLGVTNATDGANWVGAVKNFPDVDPATGRIRSNRVKTCVAVRNLSSIALAPKRVVAFDTGTAGLAGFTQTKGYSAATNEERVGVVDEHLPATGVAVNDVFWVTVEGPTEVAVALSGSDLVVGDRLAAITAAASTGTTAGRVTKSGVAAGTQLANDNGLGVLGRACSTGATTGANVLAIVKTRY
jgi:hypothetical protein